MKGVGFGRVLVYVDDVVVMGKTEEDALKNLRLVFQIFKDANPKLKVAKCTLFQKEVTFLGHVISEEGIKCDPEKIEAVRHWPRPTNVTEVRSCFLVSLLLQKVYPKFFRQSQST